MSPARNSDRPLSARSVIASTLLGLRDPCLATRLLVASGELFGIAPGTTRVAISRMVAAGELTADADGYRLAGPLLGRRTRQGLSRTGVADGWDGTWTVAVVSAEPRSAADRTRLRSAALALRLGELREGCWCRPRNLPAGVLADDEAVVARQCHTFASHPDQDPAELAARLWDLAAWATRADELRAHLAAVVGRLEAGDREALAPGFVLSADVLRHFQADPLLPVPLLPHGWPGTALRRDYDRYDAAFTALWGEWYRAHR